MINIEVIANFEREINKIDDAVNKPSTEDSLFWVNLAIAKFIKLRTNGDFIHRVGYEQTEKRREDLISLFKEASLGLVQGSQDENPSFLRFSVTYPSDFLYALNEDVVIDSVDGGHPMNTCVFECTRDSFMYRVNNSLTDFHYKYHRARPIRIRKENGCDLLTDKSYIISSYTLGYLRKPTELTLDNPRAEYTDFQDHIMYEIIKMAALMYIENQADPRYRTIINEVNTQE